MQAQFNNNPFLCKAPAEEPFLDLDSEILVNTGQVPESDQKPRAFNLKSKSNNSDVSIINENVCT